jgi:uncharacterized protein (DUF885 family)
MIRVQMHDVMREVNFADDLPAFLHFLRTDPRFYATTPEQLLREGAWIAKQFDGISSRWFGRQPRARFAIRAVPADIAPFYTTGRGGPGGYLINTYDLPRARFIPCAHSPSTKRRPATRCRCRSPPRTAAIPGSAATITSPPMGGLGALRREAGRRDGHVRDALRPLRDASYQMWRAARLVVDTGLHAKGWTRDQARAFMTRTRPFPPRDRHRGRPLHRLAGPGPLYYLGQMAIEEACARAERALGDRFDIRRFHDTVLELGSVPLPVLHARIDRFIAEGGPSPWPDEEEE